MNLILLSIFLMAILSLVYFGYQQRDKHQRRFLVAQAQGWRYSPRGWRMFVRGDYYLVGSTPTGIIWELRCVRVGPQLLWCWNTSSVSFKQGFLQIWSRKSLFEAPLPPNLLKHEATNIGSEAWQDVFLLLTTHQFKAKTYITPQLEGMMLAWPYWPQPGSFKMLSWVGGSLQIYGRYQDSWEATERIVALGTTLTARHINSPLVKREGSQS